MYTEKAEKTPDGRIEVVVTDSTTGQEISRYSNQAPDPKISLLNFLLRGGYIRRELLPNNIGKTEGLQDLIKRVENIEEDKSIVRTSDIEDVIRKGELFSEERTTILPELLPDPEIKWIRGVGRPDKPETTGDAIIGNEEECTRYLSTDGAGVGAYEWEKRGGVWHVVRGDTGWRELKGDNKAYIGNIRIRRAGGFVSVEFGGNNWDLFTVPRLDKSAKKQTDGSPDQYRVALYKLPVGFSSCANAVNTIYKEPEYVPQGVITLVGVNDVPAALGIMQASFNQSVPRDANLDMLRIGALTFPTIDTWPEVLPGVEYAKCPI